MNKKHLFLTLILSSCCCTQNTFAMKQQMMLIIQQSIQKEFLNAELIKAADQGDVKRVEELISKGADVNVKSQEDFTPLLIAAQNGHLEVVKYLISKDADVNAKSKDGFTPLYAAAQNGHLEVVRLLISNGADVNAKTKEGSTPLYAAAQQRHLKVVQYLISNGADVNAKDNLGGTPLSFATDLEIVKALIEDGHATIDPQNEEGFTPLHCAAHEGNFQVTEYLLAHGANLGIKGDCGWTPFHFAAKNGHFDVVELFVQSLKEKHASINVKNDADLTPLHVAAYKGHTEVVKVLVKALTDMNASIDPQDIKGQTPLDIATQEGHTEIVALLKATKSDQTVDPLIKKNEDVNAQDKKSVTPPSGNPKISKRVKDKTPKTSTAQQAIDLDKAKKDIETAFQNKNFTLIKKLIYNQKVSIDINKTIDGNTYLHIAAQAGQLIIARNLIERGANIDAQNENGDTPLHLACQNNVSSDVVKVLIEKKANPNIKNKDGKIPLDLVKSRTQNKTTETIIGLLKANQTANQVATTPAANPASSIATPLSASSVSTNNTVTQTSTPTTNNLSSSSASSSTTKTPTADQIKEIVRNAIDNFGQAHFNNEGGHDALLEIIKNKLGINKNSKKLDPKLRQFMQLALDTLKPQSSSSSSSPTSPINTLSRKYKRHANRSNNITTQNKNASISPTAKAPTPAPSKPIVVAAPENPFSLTECSICSEDFKPEHDVQQLTCGHIFCENIKCLNKWLLERKKECPICRKPITDAEIQNPKFVKYHPPQTNDKMLKEKEHVEDTGLGFTFKCGHTLNSADLQGKTLDSDLCPNCQKANSGKDEKKKDN